MEITNRIKELFGLHPDLIESAEPDIPSVALTTDDDSWTLITYPGTDLSPTDRAWLWNELAIQAVLVLAQEIPEIKCRIISPAEFPDGTMVNGFIQYVFPPPDVGFVQRYWWNRICEQAPTISHLLAQRIEQRWLARAANRTNPAAASVRRNQSSERKRPGTQQRRGGMTR